MRGYRPIQSLFVPIFFAVLFLGSAPDDRGPHKQNTIHIALRIASYVRGEAAVMDYQSSQELVSSMNQIWAQCGIAFVLESYQLLKPGDLGLPDSIRTRAELRQIRHKLESDRQLVVVMTDDWTDGSELAQVGADAWTVMPGNPPYGAIIDRPVSKNAQVVAHELGHYLNLLHQRDETNLLSPVVSRSSRRLTAEQCRRARMTAQSIWQAMLRT